MSDDSSTSPRPAFGHAFGHARVGFGETFGRPTDAGYTAGRPPGFGEAFGQVTDTNDTTDSPPGFGCRLGYSFGD